MVLRETATNETIDDVYDAVKDHYRELVIDMLRGELEPGRVVQIAVWPDGKVTSEYMISHCVGEAEFNNYKPHELTVIVHKTEYWGDDDDGDYPLDFERDDSGSHYLLNKKLNDGDCSWNVGEDEGYIYSDIDSYLLDNYVEDKEQFLNDHLICKVSMTREPVGDWIDDETERAFESEFAGSFEKIEEWAVENLRPKSQEAAS